MLQYKVHICVCFLLSTETTRGAIMSRVCCCGDGTTIIIISILKGYLIHTLFIKCPITEHVWQWWKINYRSTSWAIYSGLQRANTLNSCSLALHQRNCSKRDLHISLHCIQLRTVVTTGSIPLSLQRCSV